jgi:hypothetical protein
VIGPFVAKGINCPFGIFAAMYFDILMPAVLFAVTIVALFLGKRAEAKLKATVEEREFKTRDTALLVGMIIVAASIVIFVPSMALLAVFLLSYSSLLFTVSYVFSGMKKKRLLFYCGGFIVASVLAGAVGFLGVLPENLRVMGTVAFASLAFCSFFALLYALRSAEAKQKWYLAALSPALFLLLFVFYNNTRIWFPYLLDVYGITFAVLIVLYLGPMFKWKTLFIFAVFLTVYDIISVWVTGTMVQAAETLTQLNLPVLVFLPTIPPVFSTTGALLLHGLGLGDFFFTGILSTQTLKKFGKKTAIASLLTISISLGLFELILLNPDLAKALPVEALPATLPVLLGWLPVIAVKMLLARKQKIPINTTITST